MTLEIRDANLPKTHGPPKSVLEKMAALGTVADLPRTWKPLWTAMALPMADGGWVGVVGSEGRSRPVFVGAKDKTARWIDGCPESRFVNIEVAEDGRTGYLGVYSKDDVHELHAFDVATGALKRVYEGPLRSVHPIGNGLAVARNEGAIVLLALDGAAGRVLFTKEVAPPEHDLGVCHGGRVIVAFRDGPRETVVLGVYPEQPDPLRVIGTVDHPWGGYAFRVVEGRCLFQSLKKTKELLGFVEAYEAGRAGEEAKKIAAPGELAFVFVDVHELAVPQRIDMLQALRFEKDPVLPCAGGWVTRLEYSRKRSAVAVVDDATLAVRTVELPPGEYGTLIVDESGTRARTAVAGKEALEIALPDLKVRAAGPAGDFGPAGATVVGGIGLLRPGTDGRFVEVGHLRLVPHAFATTLDGKVIAACCQPKGGPRTVAVIGVYGDELRLLARLDSPPGFFYGWRRRGPRLFLWSTDFWELRGVAEAYARGADRPGLPLGELEHVAAAQPAAAPKAPRGTPRLDATIADIRRHAKRPSVPATHARLLAGTLPGDVRRVVEALSEHQTKYVTVGLDFFIGEATLDTKVPAPGGTTRDDLVVIGEDGGGNVYAIDVSDGGAEARLLFVDHEEDFADRAMGDSLEELFERSLRRAAEENDEDDDEVDDEDDDEEANEEAAKGPSGVRRFTSTEGGSNKFWEAAVEGKALTVKFGKIGTAGQTKTKSFATEAAARAELEKLVKEKLGKGYREG